MDRDWRTAKAPKWVIEAAEAEMLHWQLTAALSWPTEPKPEPMPFRWGDYDRLTGTPVPGVYFTPQGKRVERVEIRATTPDDADQSWRGWQGWRFRSSEGGDWSSSVARGTLYATERDAWLAVLWRQCEEAAETLRQIREHL